MASKSTAEMSVRRRRSHTAAQQLQPAGHRSKAAGKQSSALPSKFVANPKSVAVVPPSRQSPGRSGPKKAAKGGKKKGQVGKSAKKLQRALPSPSPACPSRAGVAGQLRGRQDTARPRPRPMQAAHEQLELLLARVEHEAAIRRRKPLPAKMVRHHMEHPPPVPTVSPRSSIRDEASVASAADLEVSVSVERGEGGEGGECVVPLAENPHQLQPEKQLALFELFSRSRPQDQDIVNILRSEIGPAGDPSTDNMRLTLQMLPLALTPGNSPYTKRFWQGHRYLRERQRLHEQLQPNDIRYKQVKILRSPKGQYFLSKTLEDELKDEKHVLDFVESELQRGHLPGLLPEQQTRQQRALIERIELDRQKQLVSDCRARYQLAEQNRSENQVTKRMLRKAKILKRQRLAQALRDARHQEQLGTEPAADKEQPSDGAGKQHQDKLPDAKPRAGQAGLDDELDDALQQRRLFQQKCQLSSLYGSPECPTPWTMFADITNTLVDQLTENMDAELHRSIAGFIKDFVDKEARHHLTRAPPPPVTPQDQFK